MPTYQSAPLYPLVFPDQAAKQNHFGVKPLAGNLLQHLPLEKSPHPSWKKEADERAMAKVANTKLGQLAMLKGPHPFKAQNKYTTYRGPANEAFKHSFSGGTVWTREAENMIGHLREDRIKQLDAVDQSTFEEVSPERLQVDIPPAETFQLDLLFSNLNSSLTEGVVSNGLLGLISSILSFFATKADKIPEHKFAEYDTLLAGMKLELDRLFDELNVYNLQLQTDTVLTAREKSKERLDIDQKSNVLRKLENDILLLIKFIKVWNSYNGQPTKTKALRLAALRNKILTEFGTYIPQEGDIGFDQELENVSADNTLRTGPSYLQDYFDVMRRGNLEEEGAGRRRR